MVIWDMNKSKYFPAHNSERQILSYDLSSSLSHIRAYHRSNIGHPQVSRNESGPAALLNAINLALQLSQCNQLGPAAFSVQYKKIKKNLKISPTISMLQMSNPMCKGDN